MQKLKRIWVDSSFDKMKSNLKFSFLWIELILCLSLFLSAYGTVEARNKFGLSWGQKDDKGSKSKRFSCADVVSRPGKQGKDGIISHGICFIILMLFVKRYLFLTSFCF